MGAVRTAATRLDADEGIPARYVSSLSSAPSVWVTTVVSESMAMSRISGDPNRSVIRRLTMQ